STSTRTLNKLKANANSGIATSLEASLSNGKKVLNVLLTMNPTDRDGNLILVMQDITTFKTAERHKSEVVNMVSKDLREPLNQVSDIFEKLEEGKGGTFTQDGTKMLSLARQSTKQMAVLTFDLLELDKIETGQLRLNQTTAASRQLLEKALNLAESIAQTARGGLNPVKIETATAMVFCDQERVIQILMNLIGNALKFSPPGAEIVLSAQKHQQLEDMVVFSVRDHGPGIPEEQKEKIFQRFEQARESDKMIGTGLGLYICQAIVELHGGRIWVENNRDGGSTFYFTLPQERRQLGPAVTKR
ncbi:MAG TPA: HAMP domain-containing sensor histidine kinase, partial [Candidatus Obscuribacter sp.]|nr:HAMP domain-containing sensor histidine kinase [Candidatus Obscuribacter sp.]